MADFIIINAGATALTDVNAGLDDVPAYTISDPITLDGAELLVVAATNNVAVMQTGASAAEKAAVAQLLSGGAAVGGTSILTLDPVTGLAATGDLDATGVQTALAAGQVVAPASLSRALRDKASKLLHVGTNPSKKTTDL